MKKNILIVDNQLGILHNIISKLEKDYNITIANNFEEPSKKVLKNIDLLIFGTYIKDLPVDNLVENIKRYYKKGPILLLDVHPERYDDLKKEYPYVFVLNKLDDEGIVKLVKEKTQLSN